MATGKFTALSAMEASAILETQRMRARTVTARATSSALCVWGPENWMTMMTIIGED